MKPIFKNYDSYDIFIKAHDGYDEHYFPKVGTVTTQIEKEFTNIVDDMEIIHIHYSKPEGLPEPEEGVFLLVSKAVSIAAKEHGRDTSDLLFIDNPIWDGTAKIKVGYMLATI